MTLRKWIIKILWCSCMRLRLVYTSFKVLIVYVGLHWALIKNNTYFLSITLYWFQARYYYEMQLLIIYPCPLYRCSNRSGKPLYIHAYVVRLYSRTAFLWLSWIIIKAIWMGKYRKDVTPLLMLWGYVLLALSHRYYIASRCLLMLGTLCHHA